MFFVVFLFLVAPITSVVVVSSLSVERRHVETRRSILTSWKQQQQHPFSTTTSAPTTASSSSSSSSSSKSSSSNTVLGWALERRDWDNRRYHVTVAWTYPTSLNSNSNHNNDVETGQSPTTTTTTPPHDPPSMMVITLELPFIDKAHSIASSLWPASLAAAILFQSPSWKQQFLKHDDGMPKNIVELGSGLGLAGLAAAASAAAAASSSSAPVTSSSSSASCSYCWLTDYEDEAIDQLFEVIEKNQKLFLVHPPASSSSSSSSLQQQQQQQHQLCVKAGRLDWNDTPERTESFEEPPVQIVLGSDVCYYYPLLRPLMDTIRRELRISDQQNNLHDDDQSQKILCLVGQSNRDSFWEMYHNIQDGCYNQKTDEREPPWPGNTFMLLYRLYMGNWIAAITTTTTEATTPEEQDWNDVTNLEPIDGILPIMALIHVPSDDADDLTPQSASLLQPYDHVATKVDEENQMKSF